MPPTLDDQLISMSYYARQQCSRQWVHFMAAMFAEFEERVGPIEADRFLEALGSRMAQSLPLPRCAKLQELEDRINGVFEDIGWGWVRIFEGDGFIEILHGAYPNVPQGEQWRSWLVPILEGIFTVWFAQQGGDESCVARLAAAPQSPGAPLTIHYRRRDHEGAEVGG